jgi:hypothetical protein
MDETAIVFITLLLLLIITCVFGGAMRPSAPVQNMSVHNSFFPERFEPAKKEEDEEQDKEGYEDDEEEDAGKAGVRDVVPEPPMGGGGMGGGGMDNSAPHGYIAEEFAAY